MHVRESNTQINEVAEKISKLCIKHKAFSMFRLRASAARHFGFFGCVGCVWGYKQ